MELPIIFLWDIHLVKSESLFCFALFSVCLFGGGGYYYLCECPKASNTSTFG